MSQINQKGRQLTGELQAVCNAKRQQLDQKNMEIRLLSDNLQHGLRFAEYLLTCSEDATLLYSRRTLTHQLSAILRTRCEVPNPYHVVDLRFNANPLAVGPNWSLGTLVVDGYQYGHRSPAAPNVSVANGRVTSSSPQRYFSTSTSSRAEPVPQLSNDQKIQKLNSISDQKLQKLQMMLQMRRMDQQRIVSKQTGSAGSHVKLPEYAAVSSVIGGISHMPHQSSNISSSNQHRQDVLGPRSSSVGYLPTAHASNFTPQHSISLAQLHDERRQMQNHYEQVTTTLQPIVIQPTNLPDQSEYDVNSWEISRFKYKNSRYLVENSSPIGIWR